MTTYPKILSWVFFGAYTSLSWATEEAIDYFELSLQKLLEVEVDVSGRAVQAIGLKQVPATNNPLHITLGKKASSLQIVTHQTIEARNRHSVVQVLEEAPGVLTGESPSEPYSFSIRGFSRDSIEVLYDGVSLGRSTLNMRPLGTNGLERVEVFMGPTLLHGDGSAGGTVNIIPRKPSLDQLDLTRVLLSYGSYNSSTQNIELARSLSQQGAVRVNLDRRISKGWVDATESESISTNLATLWQFSPQLDWRLSLNYFRDELPGYWGTPLVPASSARDPVSIVSSHAADTPNLVIDEQTRFNNYNVADQVIESESILVKTDIDWSVNDKTQAFLSLYGFNADRLWRNAEFYSFDSGTQQVIRDRLLVDHDRALWGFKTGIKHEHQLASLTNLVSATLEFKHTNFDRVVGFEPINYFVDSVDFDEPQAGVFNAAPIAERPDTFLQKTRALIVNDLLAVSDKLSIELGIRLDEIDYDFNADNFDGSSRRSIKGDRQQTSYNLAGIYSAADNTSIYISFDRQFDSLAGNLNTYGSENATRFAPAEIQQWETGVKAQLWDGHTELSLAAYHIDYQGLVQGEFGFVKNRQISQGAEFKSKIKLTEQFNVGAALAYIDAHYKDYFDTDYGRDVSNNTPINVPEKTASLWLSYNHPFSLPLEIGGSAQYVSRRFANTNNTVSLDAYQLYNIFIAYTQDNFRLSLQVRNLTDEIYAPWSDLFYPEQVLLGAPRTSELSARYVF